MAKKSTSAEAAPVESGPSFEEALARLEEIASALEDGGLGLDQSLAQYEEGIRHLKTCQQLLTRAERRIELLSGVDAQGNPVAQPFDDEATTLEEKSATRSRRRSSRSSDTAGDSDEASGEEDVDDRPRLF